MAFNSIEACRSEPLYEAETIGIKGIKERNEGERLKVLS